MIFVFSCFVYSLLIALGLYEYGRNKIKAFWYFVIVLIVNLLSVGNLGKYVMIFTLVAVTISVALLEKKTMTDTLFEVICTVTMVMMTILFVSSIGLLMFPDMIQTVTYNVIIGLLIVAIFVLIRPFRKKYAAIKPSRSVKAFSSAVLSLFIAMHGAIIPGLEYLSFANIVAVYSIVNILIIVCAHYSLIYVTSSENEKKLKEMELQATADVLERALMDSHYSISLAKSIALYLDADDSKGLKQYFYTKVEPYMNTELKNIDTLKNISEDLIRNLIYNTKKRADVLQIPMKIEVKGLIVDIGIDTLDFFKVLSIYFDNALEASENYDNPQINLIIQSNPENVSIVISNRFDNAKQDKNQQLNRGHGLGFADGYIAKYEHVTKHTYISDGVFTQKLIIRERD